MTAQASTACEFVILHKGSHHAHSRTIACSTAKHKPGSTEPRRNTTRTRVFIESGHAHAHTCQHTRTHTTRVHSDARYHSRFASHVTPRSVMPCSRHIISVGSPGHAFLFLSTQCTPTCIAQWRHTPHPTTQPWNICLQAGMQWCACNVCSRGQASGQRPSSASIFCKPRCLLLVARLQQTRLIELTLCPNLVARGRYRKRAS